MNPDLEARIEEHLGQSNTPDHDPSQLAGVRRLARRRTARHRIAAGAIGLAALAGIGSLIPTTDDSNALITATEPTRAPEPTIAPEPTPTATLPPRQTTEPDDRVGSPVEPPRALTMVSDTAGDFIVPDWAIAPGQIGFVRSTDGESWSKGNTWRLPPDTRLEDLDFVDGIFVAHLDSTDPGSGQLRAYSDPILAVSDDLVNWETIHIDLDPESTTSDPAPDPTDTTQYWIETITRNGSDLGLVLRRTGHFDPTDYGLSSHQVCGQINRPEQRLVVTCDGDIVQLDVNDPGRYGPYEHLVFVSVDGQRAQRISLADAENTASSSHQSGHALLPTDDGFTMIEPGEDAARLLPTSILDQLPGSATIVAAHTASADATTVVIEAENELFPVHITPSGVRLGSYPALVRAAPANEVFVQEIASGPAGWAVALRLVQDRLVRLERNGWRLDKFSGSPSARLHSEGLDQEVVFDTNSAQMPPGVDISLFGEVRYTHPETGQTLMELTPEEARIPAGKLVDLAPELFVHTMTNDGWTLGGNPVAGPLVLTSPTGIVREFDDGFAFDNDDITDGVETAIGSGAFNDQVLKMTDQIRFYDESGTELVTFRARSMFEQLVQPVINELDSFEFLPSPSDIPITTLILTSVDGLTWQLTELENDENGPVVTALAVGDEEVLVASLVDFIRIPLGE